MAVGIFNSGLGGLTVLDAAQRRLPDVDFLYYGDNARAPYGVRDAEDVFQLTNNAVNAMWERGCDLVILACNTASAAALRRMQEAGVPEGKRVLGVFVPLIEALTEREWGDNSPRVKLKQNMSRCLRPRQPWPAARSSVNWRFAPLALTSRRSPAAVWWMPLKMAT